MLKGDQVVIPRPSIANAGEYERERVVFRCTEDGNVGKFVMFCCYGDLDGIDSGDIPVTYWFADREAKKDDLVILYTKPGSPKEKLSSAGATSYFYYWGRDTVLWNEDKRAVLISVTGWKSSELHPDESE